MTPELTYGIIIVAAFILAFVLGAGAKEKELEYDMEELKKDNIKHKKWMFQHCNTVKIPNLEGFDPNEIFILDNIEEDKATILDKDGVADVVDVFDIEFMEEIFSK